MTSVVVTGTLANKGMYWNTGEYWNVSLSEMIRCNEKIHIDWLRHGKLLIPTEFQDI